MADHPTIAVVGGGISGLVAAHRLATAGVSVVLVERSPLLGGKVTTEEVDGFLVEGGPDSFVAGKGSVIELAGELDLADRVVSSRPEHRGSYVWSQGRLHPLPEGLLLMAPSRLAPLLRSSLLSWKGKLRVLSDLVLPRRPNHGDESLESFVVRRLGREALERIAEPLVAGIHAAVPETMSLQASFPRLLEMEREHRSLILAARSRAAQHPQDGLSYFASFRRGMGELPAALVRRLEGVQLVTGEAVTRLRLSNGTGYLLEVGHRRELQAQGVIVALPARDAAVLLSEVAPEAARAISGIRQVSAATVTLAYRTEEIPQLPGSGFVVPSVEQRRIMGVSYLSQKWEGRVPHQGFMLLRAFVGTVSDPNLSLVDEDRLVAMVGEELEEMVGITARPVLVRTHVWPDGLHQYSLGHLERVARAERAVAALPRLVLAGAAFHGIGLNECVASGRRAAESILNGPAGPSPSP